MKGLLTLFLVTWCASGAYAQNETIRNETSEQCVATFIHEGLREDVILWKGMFQLDNETILKYVQLLQEFEDANDLPRELVEAAVIECRAIMALVREHQGSESE